MSSTWLNAFIDEVYDKLRYEKLCRLYPMQFANEETIFLVCRAIVKALIIRDSNLKETCTISL